MSFRQFFGTATATSELRAGLRPFAYQRLLAEGEKLPWIVNAPTGAGKTAAAILGWLWRRRLHPSETVRAATPRRLVYCLPMRVLVEQTIGEARRWLKNLDLLSGDPEDLSKVGVYQLMGGEVENDWDARPEADTILVGTQDQLLSRALNRGYAMSRYRWPVQFGLLNNDCLWVMDEVQLMGPGLPTTLQLQAFRDHLASYEATQSLWMSATLRLPDMATVDGPAAADFEAKSLSLGPEDREHPDMSRRISAPKPLRRADVVLSSDAKATYPRELADRVLGSHEAGSLTLVILNQVRRAQDVMSALERLDVPGSVDMILLHSRFRPAERRTLQARLLSDPPAGGRIVVSTQAVEAGVDLSARTLFTELAPWSSLVQRFGRCNRYGEWSRPEGAQVYWIDVRADFNPYEEADVALARSLLTGLSDVGIPALEGIEDPSASPITQVLRRRDVIELFDTTPDLAGNDIDVSPYIRDADNLDVAVLWRDLSDEEATSAAPAPGELCPVGLPGFRRFVSALEKRDVKGPHVWDGLSKRWRPISSDRLRPGLTVLLDADAGGYDPRLGWWPEARRPEPVPVVDVTEEVRAEGYDDDHLSSGARFVGLSEHLGHVVEELEALQDLVPDEEAMASLRTAALWHDLGKAHPYFQELLLLALPDDDPRRQAGPWAKSEHPLQFSDDVARPRFRHELASALAMLQHGVDDLAAYLVASHHGKVRLSIRSLPDERHPPDGGRFARGIWEGDVLPATVPGDGTEVPETILSLQLMELGTSEAGPSWLERTLALRDQYGPFRLAYLEALLRVADWRASAKEREADG